MIHSNIYLNAKETQLFLKWQFLIYHKKKSASDNEIAKYRYLPYTALKSDRYDKPNPILKVTKFKNCAYFAKKCFKPISVFESNRVDKIKSGTSMFLSAFNL